MARDWSPAPILGAGPKQVVDDADGPEHLFEVVEHQ